MQFIGNRYDIIDYSGEIEVGRLYKARDTYYNNMVYIKLINKVDMLKNSFIPDLIDESTVLKNIKSNYIGKVLHTDIHCSEYDVYYYIVSEYFEGQTLKEFIYSNSLNRNTIVNIATQIAKALESANLNYLYHGSLNPNNILVDKNENIKIYDFGIVKANKGSSLLNNNKPYYLCPHQLNIDYTDIESDFFALGIIMFEMIFRQLPFGEYYNKKDMLKHVDKGVSWSLLNYDNTYDDIVKISKKLLSRKEKYNSTSEILIDLTCIKYEEANIEQEQIFEEYDETEISKKEFKASKKLILSMFVLVMTIMIVVGYI